MARTKPLVWSLALFVYGSYKSDEKDGTRARLRDPVVGRPDKGKERGEEGQEDQDHAAGEVPDLGGSLLDDVGQLCLRVTGPAHVLQDAPELGLAHEPDDPREVVGLPRRLAQAQQLEVVAPVQLDRPRVRGGELL